MKRALSAAVLAACACSAPSADLVVTLPKDPSLRPASLMLRVLEPQSSHPFGCDDLAYGLVPEIVLAVTEQNRTFFAPGQTAHLETPPGGERLLLVEGFDRANTATVFGCAPLGAVTGAMHLNVALEPVVHVVGRPIPERLELPTPAAQPTVALLLMDALERPVSGVVGRWNLVATGSFQQLGLTDPSVNGALVVRPVNPGRSGPFTLTVAPRWGGETAVGGVVAPELVVLPAFPPELQVLDYVSGRLGPSGEPGFTALAERDGGTTHVVVFRTGSNVNMAPGPLVPGDRRLTLLESSAPGRDTALAVGQDSWIELPPGNIVAHPFATLPAPPTQISRLWEAGEQSCASPPGLFAVRLLTNETRVFTRTGSRSPNPLESIGGALMATGCLSQLDGGTLPAAVVDLPLQATYVLRFGSGGAQPVQLLAAQQGIGFTRQGERYELLATRFDRSQYLASRLAVSQAPPPTLEATWELALPAVPLDPTGGDLDGDGKTDLAALLASPPLDGGFGNDLSVLLALGRDVEGANAPRVAGTLGPLRDVCNPRLWLQDFDGDGTDDVMLGERAPCGHPQAVRVYRMGPKPP